MLILLLKAEQLGLFEKLVPIKGSVSASGVVTPAHVGIRHVKAPVHKPAPAAAPAAPAKQPDLFGEPAAAPKPKPAPADSTLDLFAEPAPEAPKHESRVAAAPSGEFVQRPTAVDAAPSTAAAGRDQSGPFDPDSVAPFGVSPGTSKEERRKLNTDAAFLAEHRSSCSPEELALLRQYSGNGGCGDSLNEFYTDPKVAAAMWHVLGGLGVGEGAAVLEPSCATGVFLETAPAGVAMVGVEMDPVSAQIGALLHPSHTVINSSLERFSTQDTRQFDAVIGNAPFGLRGSLLKDDKSSIKTAEAYFVDTSIDKTRSGGIVAMIVPTGLMDSGRDRAVRERLLRKAEFIGAVRMPNTAFEHSHTGVTTDIVFFRKRDEEVAGALSAVKQGTLKALGIWDEDFLGGSYFTGPGAGNVLGTMTEGWRAKAGMGDDITVEGSMIGVPAAIAAFRPPAPASQTLTVGLVLEAVPDEETREKVRAAALRRPYDTSKRGDIKVVDGVEYILEGSPLRWHRVDEILQGKAVTDAQDLGAEIERAINDDGYAEASGLAERVRAYIAEHGLPSKNPNVMLAASTDKVIYRLLGAVKPDGSLSDVVAGRHVAALESSFDAAAQALALEAGQFTPTQVAGRWHGGDADTALDHLYASPDYALDPATGAWTSMDIYLSGDLWPKLDAAKAALAAGEAAPEDRAKFERQVESLETTIDPKSLEDVEVALNSAFLPLDVVAAFFNRDPSKFEGSYAPQRMAITFDKGVYAVKGGPWGSQLLEKYLNRSGIRKDDDLPTIEVWNAEFKTWLCGSTYRDEIEELYNRSFRGFRQRAYSEAPFEIPGLNSDGLKAYQYSGLRWALEAGKGIIAADVGLGKTARGLMLARMMKVTGRAKRPMIVVPKSVLANWLAEAEKWFPGSKVLTIGETYTRDKDGNLKGKQDSAAERNRKFHDLTQNEYDFILISQPSFNDIDLDPELKKKYLDDDFWVQRGDSLGNAGDKRTKQVRERYDQYIANREFERRSDAIYFNDLGIDAIIGDEMHAYKNLYAAKNRFGATPKFLGGQGLSNRALDMNLKARWIREQTDGQNIYGLTATPTKNSPLEVYSMLSHIAPEAFERIGIRNSEEFLDRFCEFKEENILTTGGKIESALVTVGFKNMDELREIMRRYIDRTTADDVGLVLPKRDDRQHLIDMSAEQQAVYADLRVLAEESKGKDASGDAHIFSIMDKMAKAAMDLELLDPVAYAGAKSPKYAVAAANIVAGAKDGGQVVFADNIGVHDKMVAALVAAGIPRDQIAVINAQVAASSSARQNIADAFNAGKLKVVIGNTATMGEGINLQKGTTDIHHLDLPWEPASMQQRNGRGLRQGNVMESVRIHAYICKGSFDGYRYQTIRAKKDWQEILWHGGDRVENLSREGALSRDDLMVMLAADPEEARKSLDGNKALAQQKFDAQKHGEAADDFGRFSDMRHSYAALKNKATAAGERLRIRIDRLRTALEGNEYFKPKHALEAKTPVVIQRETGHAFEAGHAFEIEPAEGAVQGGGKFVVTGVMPQVSSIRVRRYGQPNAGAMVLEVKDLAKGVKAFDFDEGAESRELAAHLAESAKAKLSSLNGMSDLHGLPSAAIEAAHDPIQRQLKEALQAYKWHPHAGLGMVHKETGEVRAVPGYEARHLVETHDFMLPTDANRQKVTDAFLEAERGKKVVREAVLGRRGGSTNETKVAVKYTGASISTSGSNPWGQVADETFGKGFQKELRDRYGREQVEKARHTASFGDAVADVAHAALGGGVYGMTSWPRRGLAVLWARAKRAGILDQAWRDVVKTTLPDQVFGLGYQTKVSDALMALAKDHGHPDLAAAMLLTSTVPLDDKIKRLVGMNMTPGVRSAIGHLVAKNPELATKPVQSFMHRPYTYEPRSNDAYHAMGGKTLADLAEIEGDDRRAA